MVVLAGYSSNPCDHILHNWHRVKALARGRSAPD